MNRFLFTILMLTTIHLLAEESGKVSGIVKDEYGKPIQNALVFIKETSYNAITDREGLYTLEKLPQGKHHLVSFVEGYQTKEKEIFVRGEVVVDFTLSKLSFDLEDVVVSDDRIEDFGINWLNAVSGTGIYEAKKTEVIKVDELIANKAANVSRQVYSRVAGLNIWENDGAGVQLGIGGRGLNPNRTSNFNVRQNGYDIAADALGYPESYYTPPAQAIDRIEIIRGAASLQYGTQFGGMLNFKFKEGSRTEKTDVKIQNTLGSFGLFNSFNSVGGTIGKVRYYGFFHHKRSNGWRANSNLDQITAYGSIKYQISPLASIKFEQTHMDYLAQQPGGLTDNEFYQNPRQSKRNRNWFKVRWNISALIFDYRFTPSLKINNRTFRLEASRSAIGNLGRIDRPDNPASPRNLLKDDYLNWGNEFRLIYHYNLLGKKSVLLAGNRLYQGMTVRKQGFGDNTSEPDFTFKNQEFPEDSYFDLPSQNLSLFIENIFNLSEKFSVTPGLRYEFIRTEADGYYVDRRTDLAGNIIFEDIIEEQKSKDRSFFIGGIGVSYKHNPEMEIYGNFSQNFRAINFNDIRVNNPSLSVDENISDENGYNLDFGIRGNRRKSWRYDVSLFYLSYNDRIGSVFRTEPDPRFNNVIDRAIRFRTNVADASIAGIESFAEIDLLRLLSYNSKNHRLSGFVNFAYIYAQYTNSEEKGIEGNEVEMVPPVNLKSGFTYRYKTAGMSFQYGYVMEHYSDATNAVKTPTAVEGIIPSYHVMDLSGFYEWKWLTLEAGINNLTNAYYFTRRAAGYPGPGIIPSDGRSVYLTLGLDF